MRDLSVAILTLLAGLFSGCAGHCNYPASKSPRSSSIQSVKSRNATIAEFETLIFGEKGDPQVLLLHEMTGPTAETILLAKQIASWGYHVSLPNLYGSSVVPFGESHFFKAKRHLKTNDDWHPFYPEGMDGIGPIEDRIGRLVDDIHQSSDRQVAVIGNCLTGILPFRLMAHPAVSLGILAQPATPAWAFLWEKNKAKAHLGLSPASIAQSVEALKQNPDKRVVGFHYSNDPIATIHRFRQIHDILQKEGSQLESRFTTYILHPPEETPAQWWSQAKPTQMRRGLIQPHSTITHAKSPEDREWLRARLREELAAHHR